MKTAIAIGVLCVTVAFDVGAGTVLYYGERSVPDPVVVSGIAVGYQQARSTTKRSSWWSRFSKRGAGDPTSATAQPDVITLREARLCASARAAVAQWQNLRTLKRKPMLTAALYTDGSRSVLHQKPTAIAIAIRFPAGSARIPQAATPSLDAVATGIRRMRLRRPIVIEGHTAAGGSDAVDARLSGERADSVKRYLVSRHGIAPALLHTVGVGSKRPLNKRDPRAVENSRVQFRFGLEAA